MNKELSIRCGKETEYDLHTPVSVRKHFEYTGADYTLIPEGWKP